MVTAADPLLLVLAGPTGSGKTALSVELAERFGGEVVSCDSVAVYRGVEIGAAKPGRAERERVPHHCLDLVTPAADYSAGDYQRDARAALAQIAARGRLPIVTGGTGLYLRALRHGLFEGPRRSAPLRARLRRSGERHGAGWLTRLLRRLDPVAAERIHANDMPKLIRAIEVSLETRRPMTEAWQAGAAPLTGFRVLCLGLAPERGELYRRIDARAAAMFADGLVEETRALMAAYGAERPVFGALGYRQARQVLRGELSPGQALASAQQGHRNYAKRQMTWFRREPEMTWLAGFGDRPETAGQAAALVSAALASTAPVSTPLAGAPGPDAESPGAADSAIGRRRAGPSCRE